MIKFGFSGGYYKWTNWNQFNNNTLTDMMNWLNNEIMEIFLNGKMIM